MLAAVQFRRLFISAPLRPAFRVFGDHRRAAFASDSFISSGCLASACHTLLYGWAPMLGRVGVHFAPLERYTADRWYWPLWRRVTATEPRGR